MHYVVLENDRNSLELLRDHLLLTHGTLLACVCEDFDPSSGVYETFNQLECVDWSGDKVFTVLSETKRHRITDRKKEDELRQIIYSRERTDLESFVRNFFVGVKIAFGFNYQKDENGD